MQFKLWITCSKNNKTVGFATSNIYRKLTTTPFELIQILKNHISDDLSEYVKIFGSRYSIHGLDVKEWLCGHF